MLRVHRRDMLEVFREHCPGFALRRDGPLFRKPRRAGSHFFTGPREGQANRPYQFLKFYVLERDATTATSDAESGSGSSLELR